MNFYKHISTLMVAVSIMLCSCNKKYLDINTNPNSLTSSTPDYVFTGAVNRTAAFIGPNEIGSYWSGQWTQSTTYAYSSANFSYQFNNTNYNWWDTWYDILSDFQYVITNADDKAMPFFKGPAKVMKAFIFSAGCRCLWQRSLFRCL